MDSLGADSAKHRRAIAPRGDAKLGNDGLTDDERRQFLTSFRQGIGSKPAADGWFHGHADLMADKLADSARRVDR